MWAHLGLDSIWLSPFYTFGGVDLGNDVVNHTTVSPAFGTEDSLNRLLTDLGDKNFKTIIEFIPNHTSNQSEWFRISSDPSHNLHEQFKDYYVWRNGRTAANGTLEPPNEVPPCSVFLPPPFHLLRQAPSWPTASTPSNYTFHVQFCTYCEITLASAMRMLVVADEQILLDENIWTLTSLQEIIRSNFRVCSFQFIRKNSTLASLALFI